MLQKFFLFQRLEAESHLREDKNVKKKVEVERVINYSIKRSVKTRGRRWLLSSTRLEILRSSVI
jgi:hypothetical protein